MTQYYRTEDAPEALELTYHIEQLQEKLLGAVRRSDMAASQEIMAQQNQAIAELVRLQKVYQQHKRLVAIVKRMSELGVEMEVVIRETRTRALL